MATVVNMFHFQSGLKSGSVDIESRHLETALSPHQVCQVGFVSAHELPVLADGCQPVVHCFVQVLPDIILQVVSVSEKIESKHTPNNEYYITLRSSKKKEEIHELTVSSNLLK